MSYWRAVPLRVSGAVFRVPSCFAATLPIFSSIHLGATGTFDLDQDTEWQVAVVSFGGERARARLGIAVHRIGAQGK